MRERKLDQISSNANYATGGFIGAPTKITPPAAAFTDGAVPDRAYGAQWKNYVDHYLQRQIEVSALLPYRNWGPPCIAPSVWGTSTIRFRAAHNPYHGATLLIPSSASAGTGVQLVPEIDFAFVDTELTLNFTPIALTANFAPRCVTSRSHADDGWYVGGANAVSPTQTIWQVNPDLTTALRTSAVSGSVEHIMYDRVVSNVYYALAADTNRTLLIRNNGTGNFDAVGNRGSGSFAPSATLNHAAAANGVIVVARTTGTNLEVHYMTASPFTFNTKTIAATGTILDCTYSPQLGKWMILTTNNWYVFADPSQTNYETFSNKDTSTPALNITGGCLTDTGHVSWANGSRSGLVIRDWPGATPLIVRNTYDFEWVRYDGSAIWAVTRSPAGPTVYISRSMRSHYASP